MIGGYSGGSENEVWIYEPQNGFTRNKGPSLNKGRFYHSCSTMRDGEKTVIIVAGGRNQGFLDSVEIYDPTDNNWHSGKIKMPNNKIITKKTIGFFPSFLHYRSIFTLWSILECYG